MRWKALAEIYTMHSFAPFSKLTVLFKNLQKSANFAKFKYLVYEILLNLSKCRQNSSIFVPIFIGISRNFVISISHLTHEN